MESPTINPASKKGESYGALIAIIVATILGVIVGLFYGEQMWIAGGGPAKELERLEATLAQQAARADAMDAKDPQAAKRLRDNVPKINERIDEVNALAGQPTNALAYFTWEVTKFCGDIFLQALRLLVVPLVVTSMFCGITSLGDVRKLGKLGGWTMFYYIVTCAIAVLIGMILVLIVRPGIGAENTFEYVEQSVSDKAETSALDTLLSVVRGREGDPSSGMIPNNLFLAASNTNVLALIVFTLIFGGAITTLHEKGKPVIDFMNAANEAIMLMVHLVMWFAPIGIFGLVAFEIAKQGGGEQFGAQLAAVSKYVVTVIVGLLLHSVVLTITLAMFARRNPFHYLLGISRALITALTTSSSSATLPITIECVEEIGVRPRTAGFVLPLGATVNMDGTALYEAVAVIFIAQSMNIDLALGQLVVIFLTATLAAIGAAGIPSAGLVTMVIVLTAVGLPISGIGLILAIDWFLDRLRTTVNVYGDAVGAGVIDKVVDV